MGNERTRIHLEATPELRTEVEAAAAEAGLSMSQLFRMSFGLFKLYRRAKRDGQHLGFASDPAKLDREIMEVL